VIGMLRGRVAGSSLGRVLIEVGGVGYRVAVPLGTPAGRTGDELVLHTHLAVREDSLTLYGFAGAGDRDVFEVLLGVTGVGPKVALAGISALGADGLRRAVVTEDVAALTAIPGVGRKGAQRMILELRERLGAGSDSDLVGASPSATDPRGEAAEALAALGYAPAEAQRALDAAANGSDATAEDLVRAALRAIARR